ncbi:hypothetical protein F5X71_15505 [Nocardia brasiliensis]|uniref:Uncharacterized protein n=1 Tax=Nocardia brasiliensis TaxID=37326 RepID=A0A6G9XRG3_NOCBR|nr:hypothetical protein [Nocardia brasiliensis]QIS03541.1 hypothetical protein F5X71_15505 [Nocardia brasiliensis]
MATIAQLRAILAVLNIDPGETDALVTDGIDPAVERAKLAALLQRVFSSELRSAVTNTPDQQELARRWTAASTQSALDGENATEQAHFDAHWLHNRIDALAPRHTSDQAPVLLDAAARAAEAAQVLLSLSSGNPHGDGTESLWQTALDDLASAFHLINDEHNAITQPIE